MTDARQISHLLTSASQCIADARRTEISTATRMEAAYRAIMQFCLTALWANGYRPSKSKPGHHQTMIQSLVHSVRIDINQIALLDTFRVKRNAIDYSGEAVDAASVDVCISAAENLGQSVIGWLKENRPELIIE